MVKLAIIRVQTDHVMIHLIKDDRRKSDASCFKFTQSEQIAKAIYTVEPLLTTSELRTPL